MKPWLANILSILLAPVTYAIMGAISLLVAIPMSFVVNKAILTKKKTSP